MYGIEATGWSDGIALHIFANGHQTSSMHMLRENCWNVPQDYLDQRYLSILE
jgi:hypothetical protein